MSTGILAGNYPPEVWSKVAECVANSDFAEWTHLVYGSPPEAIKSPYFLLIDIHGFSRFCQDCENRTGSYADGMKQVAKFLRAFFLAMSTYIDFKGGSCLKFIGDAILAIHEDKWILIKLGNELLMKYRNDFKKTYTNTDVVVVIAHPKKCIKGFVAGSAYVDYSYWAPGLNRLFTQTKKLQEGHVYYLKDNGDAQCYDLQYSR